MSMANIKCMRSMKAYIDLARLREIDIGVFAGVSIVKSGPHPQQFGYLPRSAMISLSCNNYNYGGEPRGKRKGDLGDMSGTCLPLTMR